jgi:hypothetical protein
VPLSNNFEFEIKLFQILARIQTTLLSFLFKNFSIIKRIINKETLKLYAVQTYLRITSAALLPSFSNSFAFTFLKSFWNSQNLPKMKYICKKFIIHQITDDQIKNCLLFRCRHAVVIMQILNLTHQCSLFMTVRNICEISDDNHPPPRHWWTSDFANAFVLPGVNSRVEFVSPPRAYTPGTALRIRAGCSRISPVQPIAFDILTDWLLVASNHLSSFTLKRQGNN